MNQREFGECLNDVSNIFSKTYAPAQAELIYKHAETISKSQFDKVIKHFVLVSKFPSPMDLINGIIAEKSKSKIWEELETPFKLKCEDCADTGFMFVKEPTVAQPLLMRCYCDEGSSNDEFENIPQWTSAFAQFYSKQPFPVESFKPTGTFDKFVKSLVNSEPIKIMQRWQARKQFSQDYWKYQIEEAVRKKAAEHLNA